MERRSCAATVRGWARVLVSVLGSAFLIAPALSAQAPSLQPAVGGPFEIVPGTRFGPIREQTTRAALSAMFPPEEIDDTEIYVAEGFCTDGTRVFPGSADEIDVAWQDASRSRVAFVRTTGPSSRWATSSGVRVGSLLTDLERLSGTVLTFSGFGWDYGGGLDWRESTGGVGLRLAFDPADAETGAVAPGADEIFGDRPVRSDHPLIRRLRVRVTEIIQSWGTHAGERDCA